MSVSDTSIAAWIAAQGRIVGWRRRVYEAIRVHGPVTDKQICPLIGKPINCVTNRRGELVARRLVKQVSIDRGCKVWAAVPPGEFVPPADMKPKKMAAAQLAAQDEKRRLKSVSDAARTLGIHAANCRKKQKNKKQGLLF